MVDATISPGRCAIWPAWAAPAPTSAAKRPPWVRPLRAVAPPTMALPSPAARRRTPDHPAHAPGRTISWHQPSRLVRHGCRRRGDPGPGLPDREAADDAGSVPAVAQRAAAGVQPVDQP